MVRSGAAVPIETEYAVVGTVLHVALSLVGLRWIGPQGVVLGTALGSLLGVAWFVLRVERWLGPAAIGSTLKAALPLAIAAAAAGIAAVIAAGAGAGLSAGRGRGLASLAAGATAFVVVDAAVLLFAFPTIGAELRARARVLLTRAPRP